MRRPGVFVAALALGIPLFAAAPASATDLGDVEAVIAKWVGDFNRGDQAGFRAACEPQAAIIDGFPPYARQSCAEWMDAYVVNNAALKAQGGRLAIGKAAYAEVQGDRAYIIYPATFSHTRDGKPVVYKDSWTMTLHKTPGGWKFTGSSSAWGENSLQGGFRRGAGGAIATS